METHIEKDRDIKPQELLGQDEVARTRDREPFGNPLDQPQEQGLYESDHKE